MVCACDIRRQDAGLGSLACVMHRAVWQQVVLLHSFCFLFMLFQNSCAPRSMCHPGMACIMFFYRNSCCPTRITKCKALPQGPGGRLATLHLGLVRYAPSSATRHHRALFAL